MPRALVLVTSSFPIRDDGSEAAGSFVADVVEELSHSIPIRVVAPGAITVRERWSERVEVFRYAAPARPLSTLKPWRPSDLLWIVRVLRGGHEATKAAVQDGAVAHILALWGLPCGEWARRVAHTYGITYSVWLLGSDVWSLGRIPLVRGRLARVIREAAHAYADGYQLTEDAKQIAGVPVAFLPSTRRIESVNPPPPRSEPPYRLLFLGRWHLNKGIDLLLDALALLADEDWHRIENVEIQGGGPLAPLVRERVVALRAIGRPVELGGFLAKREAEAAIIRADWLVIPSRIESIPVVFSDAIKLGRPVVATPVGDLPRLVHDASCGVLASAVTKQALAIALRQAARTETAAFRDGIAFKSECFDLAAIASKITRKTTA